MEGSTDRTSPPSRSSSVISASTKILYSLTPLSVERDCIDVQAVMEFFGKFIDITGTDLQFVVDDISQEDLSVVGVTWHLEWKGKPFPFSKVCSFYRLQVIDVKRQITYVSGRDSVEPAIKPGETALVCFRTPSPLLLTRVLPLSCAELYPGTKVLDLFRHLRS